MAAQLVCALEEDHTGRTPIDPALMSSEAWEDPRFGHVFWVANDTAIGFATVELTSGTTQLAMIPDCHNQTLDFARALQRDLSVNRVWARGERSAAAGLSGTTVRRLAILSRSLTTTLIWPTTTMTVRPFDPVSDVQAWLQANAEIFAALPDQANTSATDLAALQQEPWFDATGFWVALDGRDDVLGFHWTKLTADERLGGTVSGEVYVLGVRPSQQGSGLAGDLLNIGLLHLQSRGARRAHLWVESDNTRAVSFYERYDFQRVDSDALISLER
ncbi:MAG: GNAT family N-acetyltransferase [Actinomycetia bacterium]|nr:GNAT family N-acetyltransferase [Actinomycetes bacterium]